MTNTLQRTDSSDPAELLGIPGLETRSVAAAQLRAGDNEDGTFDGYACLWGVKDSYGTTFDQGCFSAGGLDGDLYAYLDMHSPFVVIGTFTAAEDDKGLKIAGSWDDTTNGRDARVQARTGSKNGLSVGFVPLMVDPDAEDHFTQCRLVEVSQITRRMAAVPGAELSAARKRFLASLDPSAVDPLKSRDRAILAAARLRLLALG
jgi:HK97 family phage prohead protease